MALPSGRRQNLTVLTVFEPKMSPLPFDRLRVTDFRMFRDMELTNLGRVNLIVGKNNSGKTSLLDALRCHKAGGPAVGPVNWKLDLTAPDVATILESILIPIDPMIRKVCIRGNAVHVDDVNYAFRLGNGLARVVDLVSRVAWGDENVVLIDEMENGINPCAYFELWKGIAIGISRRPVQVFATTHSQSFIEAAHNVLSQQPDYGLSVIQLFRHTAGEQGQVLGRECIQVALDNDMPLCGLR